MSGINKGEKDYTRSYLRTRFGKLHLTTIIEPNHWQEDALKECRQT